MLNVFVATNGCPGAQLASEHIERFFMENNCKITRELDQSDLVIFYACALTKEKENGSLVVIRTLKSGMKPNGRLIVWGCLDKINPSAFVGTYDGPVVGPKDFSFFESLVKRIQQPIEEEVSANTLLPPITASPSKHFAVDFLKTLAYVIGNTPLWYQKYRNPREYIRKGEIYYIHTSTGCTSNCTYCTEKLAFGHVKSKTIEKIASEFKRGLNEGYGRFCLLSWDLGAYGADTGFDLCVLLRELANIGEARKYKIILPQINPSDLARFYPELEKILRWGKIEEIGCQVQSGSNRILELMGRKYTVEEWLTIMLKIKKCFPEIFLTTHFMVGFPTETNEDFNATMQLLDKISLDDVVIFKYSRNQSTASSRMAGQIPESVKEARYRRLLLKVTLNILVTKMKRLVRLK